MFKDCSPLFIFVIVVLVAFGFAVLLGVQGCCTVSGSGDSDLGASRELLEREQLLNQELTGRLEVVEATNRKLGQDLGNLERTIGRIQDTVASVNDLQDDMAQKLRRSIEALKEIAEILRDAKNLDNSVRDNQ